jgi:hypothetical protein
MHLYWTGGKVQFILKLNTQWRWALDPIPYNPGSIVSGTDWIKALRVGGIQESVRTFRRVQESPALAGSQMTISQLTQRVP